jgi:hypothetical protein
VRVPARDGNGGTIALWLRAYLGEAWDDHWVCEYWSGREARWCRSDAQLDEVTRVARGVTFDTANVPRDRSLTAGEAWLRCRADNDRPERFGHGDTNGLWFMKVNAVRDAFAVDNRETTAWDRWPEAPPELRTVSHDEIAALDTLSRNPEQPVEWLPSWLSGVA